MELRAHLKTEGIIINGRSVFVVVVVHFAFYVSSPRAKRRPERGARDTSHGQR